MFGSTLLSRVRALATGPIAIAEPEVRAPVEPPAPEAAADPIRSFAEWAAQRAEGICWVAATAAVDDVFQALAADLPELGRSGVRWSGAGVLHDSAVEWFAFERGPRAVLVFALSADRSRADRQLGVLRALSLHGAFTVAGGAMPIELEAELLDARGVPAWDVVGAGGLGADEPRDGSAAA